MAPSADLDPGCTSEHGCITCGDEAVPMRVAAVDAQRELALCRSPDGANSSVEIALVGPLSPGDVVLVHAGTALTRVEEEATA